MRALVYDAVGAAPEVRQVPEPACPADGVLVAVAATGVCRSDWHAWRGHDPVVLPHVGGHELAGTVAAVGPEVRGFAVGDRVTTPFVNGCGRCAVCAAGNPQVCPDQTQPGFTGPGSFADLVALHAAEVNLVRLPDALGDVPAAALGCRFATAYRALTAHARLGPGQWLAVHGCGGVGLSAVAIGAALGARVVAVDLSPAALGLARELGAEATVQGRDPVAEVHQVTGGGAHASVDAYGSPGTAAASVRSLRRRGRHLQVGLLLDPAGTSLPMDAVVSRELELYGSHGMAAADYPPMLALVASGAVRLDRLVGRVISLDEVPAALAAMDAPSAATAGMTVVDLALASSG
ncbi:zinc-dependent alcohol dehydrogenase family protein [uncultured Friedmanniella sp.]|uniref:zinc-dependent alcohol dehydrogenase family protein n=1 Tax=uncultured Friedmanniella sp. TaxID=335381 RepID=UPI0035CAEADA